MATFKARTPADSIWIHSLAFSFCQTFLKFYKRGNKWLFLTDTSIYHISIILAAKILTNHHPTQCNVITKNFCSPKNWAVGPKNGTFLFYCTICLILIWLPQSGPIYALTADLNPLAEMSASVDWKKDSRRPVLFTVRIHYRCEGDGYKEALHKST